MEDIDKITKAVGKVYGIKPDRIRAKVSSTYEARMIVCYIVRHDLDKMKRLAVDWDTTIGTVCRMHTECDKLMSEGNPILKKMNAVRKRLNLAAVYPDVSIALEEDEKRQRRMRTKSLFGFSYTEEDEARILSAMRSSAEFMKKFCRMGRKPIPEGMVFQR